MQVEVKEQGRAEHAVTWAGRSSIRDMNVSF